jgi:hypothetical protein
MRMHIRDVRIRIQHFQNVESGFRLLRLGMPHFAKKLIFKIFLTILNVVTVLFMRKNSKSCKKNSHEDVFIHIFSKL